MSNLERFFKDKKIIVLLVAFLGLILLGANFYSQTIISISQIYVDPQGSEGLDGEWKGSFWNIVASVSINDYVAGVVLPKGQEATISLIDETLKTGAKIEIRIDPQTPYLIRRLQEKTVEVVPSTGQTYMHRYTPSNLGENLNVATTSLWLNYYDWAELQWRIYTPFLVTVFKDGVQVGQALLNSEGSMSTQIISTSEGNVRVENLGTLGGQYLDGPNLPTQIALFKGYPNLYDWTQVRGIIDSGDASGTATYTPYYADNRLSSASGRGQYYTYWFGNGLVWTSNRDPSAFSSYQSLFYGGSNIGGWQNADDSFYYRRNPVRPVIGANDKSTLPSDKRGLKSLTEYIEQDKGVQNLASLVFANSLFSSAQIVTEGTSKALKLTVPWSAYGTPMVNIRVPTELADTWVDRPQISDVTPSASWDSNGGDSIEITGTARLRVDLTQASTVLSTTRVIVQKTSSNVGVNPVEYPSVSIAAGATQTVYFDVTNLGVTTRESNIPLDVICYDVYTGQETGRDRVYVTLLPNLAQEQTTLEVLAIEKGFNTPIVGLQVNIVYSSDTKTGFTGTDGKVTFGLQTSAGGGYSGPVTVTSAETDLYLAESRSFTIGYGVNSYTLDVRVKGQEYPTDWSWLAWFALPLTAGVVGALMLKRRKR